MHLPDQLINQVMALSPAARAELVTLLQESLPIGEAPGATGSDDQLAAEWTEELDRRIAEMRAGESLGVDAETAFAEVRKRLASSQGTSGG
jgi:putative addiction module component (TIGR02574 family)